MIDQDNVTDRMAKLLVSKRKPGIKKLKALSSDFLLEVGINLNTIAKKNSNDMINKTAEAFKQWWIDLEPVRDFIKVNV